MQQEAFEKPFLTTWMLQAAVRELGLPGLPRHWSNIARAADRGRWRREANPRRRGGYIYAINSLPEVARRWIADHLAEFREWVLARTMIPGWATALDAAALLQVAAPPPAARAAGAEAAAPSPIRRRRRSGLDRDEQLRDVVIGYVANAARPNSRRLRELVRAELGRDVPLRTLQHWVRHVEERYRVELTSLRSPDRGRSLHLPAQGRADAGVTRVNQRWELDATKADLLLADGRRYTLIGALDVASRRLKLRVVESSSAVEVGLLIRAAILDWGVPEQIVTDNGKDFTAHHVKRVLGALAIEQRVLPPYQPQKKPFIERALGTFNHDLVEELEGFVGHSVADVQALRDRRSFAQSMLKEPVELKRLSPAELQRFCDHWCEHRYGRAVHSATGETPFAIAQRAAASVRRVADPAALDILLREAPDGHGLRTVTKKGIKVAGHWYGADFLGDPQIAGRQVRVFLDPLDAGRLSVFDAGLERWLGQALCPELLGIPREEAAALRQKMAAEAKARFRAGIADFRRSYRARRGRGDRGLRLLAADVAAGEKVVGLAARGPVHSTPAIAAAYAALQARAEPTPPPLSREEADRAFEAAFAPRAKAPEPLRFSPVTGRPITADESVMVRWLLGDPERCDERDRVWLRGEFKSPSFRLLYGEKPAWIDQPGPAEILPEKKTGTG